MSTRHSFLSTTGLVRPLQLPKRPFISTAATVNVSKPETPSRRSQVLNTARARLASIAAVNVLVICALLSFLFIGSLSFAFIGGAEVASFKDLLDDIEKNEPGLVLLGEDVDVDIDEPSVTIRWSLIACGEAYFLPGSQGIHGSSGCGVPNMTVDIFVDGDEDAAFKYDPANIPLASTNGARHGIQDLTRFDSDHVLDVHEALLYPFDDYAFTTTLYAEDPGSESPITIQKLHTVNTEISFNIKSEDMQTYSVLSDGTQRFSRDLTMSIKRPAEAKAFVLLFWMLSWVLTHVAFGQVPLAISRSDPSSLDAHAAVVIAVLFVIPQLRKSMPDEPGLDGVLIGGREQVGVARRADRSSQMPSGTSPR
ncbi:hypothetical protein BC834DRAFT_576879 [Gloeopeniophorella convolvens]|nr:hypothetical protein BC834DRAFT_576879 [Gloeopeniophorella convolvens]